MRYDKRQKTTAAELLKTLSERELAEIIWKYGEERFASKIARNIVKSREAGKPVQTTWELRSVIEQSVPRKAWPKKIDVSTKTFQAIRIYTNNELDSLGKFLEQVPERLSPGGRLFIISFNSLEDSIIKTFIKRESASCTCEPGLPVCACRGPRMRALTRKPVRPSEDEIKNNPRARSAKLRVAERLEVA